MLGWFIIYYRSWHIPCPFLLLSAIRSDPNDLIIEVTPACLPFWPDLGGAVKDTPTSKKHIRNVQNGNVKRRDDAGSTQYAVPTYLASCITQGAPRNASPGDPYAIDSELQCQTVSPDFAIIGFSGLPPTMGSGRVLTCENPIATQPGIETCSPRRKVSSLTTTPPRLPRLIVPTYLGFRQALVSAVDLEDLPNLFRGLDYLQRDYDSQDQGGLRSIECAPNINDLLCSAAPPLGFLGNLPASYSFPYPWIPSYHSCARSFSLSLVTGYSLKFGPSAHVDGLSTSTPASISAQQAPGGVHLGRRQVDRDACCHSVLPSYRRRMVQPGLIPCLVEETHAYPGSGSASPDCGNCCPDFFLSAMQCSGWDKARLLRIMQRSAYRLGVSDTAVTPHQALAAVSPGTRPSCNYFLERGETESFGAPFAISITPGASTESPPPTPVRHRCPDKSHVARGARGQGEGLVLGDSTLVSKPGREDGVDCACGLRSSRSSCSSIETAILSTALSTTSWVREIQTTELKLGKQHGESATSRTYVCSKLHITQANETGAPCGELLHIGHHELEEIEADVRFTNVCIVAATKAPQTKPPKPRTWCIFKRRACLHPPLPPVTQRWSPQIQEVSQSTTKQRASLQSRTRGALGHSAVCYIGEHKTRTNETPHQLRQLTPINYKIIEYSIELEESVEVTSEIFMSEPNTSIVPVMENAETAIQEANIPKTHTQASQVATPLTTNIPRRNAAITRNDANDVSTVREEVQATREDLELAKVDHARQVTEVEARVEELEHSPVPPT
ncbi:hypothetical protein PR048_018364 [Dryococelus australis]|uniref:Uncharacterized protein n=1 Tax=Dryococelus australis TaxID=614101 RepID=A0ABQ9HC37_9NEOP|nr:hypothetical protein PR048_018364 [Dryococelus australis]